MDFVRSHFGKMNLWPVEHFLSIFVITFGWVCCCTCCTHLKVMTNMLKKVFNWSEVHVSEVNSYKIHTLAANYSSIVSGVRYAMSTGSLFKCGRNQSTMFAKKMGSNPFWKSFVISKHLRFRNKIAFSFYKVRSWMFCKYLVKM